MNLIPLVQELDELLKIREIKDYPNALNGLQVENPGEVTCIAGAVDACESVLESAVEAGADFLVVHHGLFWGGLSPIVGAGYRKMRLCLDYGLAVYSAHLPLDAHPKYGNNALLCDALGLPAERDPFLGIGWRVNFEITRTELTARLEAAVGGPVRLAPGGNEEIRSIGVVTGGAGSQVHEAAKSVDAFITGEGPHWTYTAAEESQLNLFYAGHYATETFGVKTLTDHLSEKHNLQWEFIDHPTGL